MKNLGKPELEVNAKDIFELCARGYNDQVLVRGLLECSKNIEDDSRSFESCFPDDLCGVQRIQQFTNGITNKQMKDLYKSKFAKINSPGRKYYDLILSSPRGKICPFCGERIVRNLDHYLPESLYSTLVVTPSNLIPICSDCNYDKRAYEFEKPEDAPLHPYYDCIDGEIWLYAKPLQHQVVKYYVDCPEKWNETLKSRVGNHLILFKLDQFYALKASQEIADEIGLWKRIIEKTDLSQLVDYLNTSKSCVEENYQNSWKAALYRGLLSNIDSVLGWLSSLPSSPTLPPVDPNPIPNDV